MAAAAANGNGHSRFASLSALTGARIRVEERISLPVSSLADAMQEIRKLGATGELTISFLNGSAAGDLHFRTTRKQST